MDIDHGVPIMLQALDTAQDTFLTLQSQGNEFLTLSQQLQAQYGELQCEDLVGNVTDEVCPLFTLVPHVSLKSLLFHPIFYALLIPPLLFSISFNSLSFSIPSHPLLC
jgi:hypothetical protein